jgi:tetrahydromethanopterin S-methyltransferase subunit G
MSSRSVEERISFLEGKVEGSLEQINKRLEGLERRIEVLDKKIDERFLTLDNKIDSQFKWIVGEMIAIIISWIIPVLLKIYFP